LKLAWMGAIPVVDGGALVGLDADPDVALLEQAADRSSASTITSHRALAGRNGYPVILDPPVRRVIPCRAAGRSRPR
jgi:hypothetical protein